MTILPPPLGTAISLSFADGHVEHVPDEATVDELVAATHARISSLEDAHGPVETITPASGRFTFVSPPVAARLHAEGVDTINTSGMDRDEFLALLPTLDERWK